LAVGARNEEPAPALRTLALLSALSFAGIDVVHAARRRISPMYLGDAVVELALVAAILELV
jgi:hypothetical protein